MEKNVDLENSLVFRILGQNIGMETNFLSLENLCQL